MENTEIIIKELAVINTAGQILTTNLLRVDKGEANGKVLAQRWQDVSKIEDVKERVLAMSAIDTDTNAYLAACTSVIKELKANREPVTQLMTEFARKFSSAENRLDKANTASVAYQLQQKRNEYATLVANMKRQAEEDARREAALQLAKSNYTIDVKAGITNLLNNEISNKKENINKYINGATLDTVATIKQQLQNWDGTIDAILFKNKLEAIPANLQINDKQAILVGLLGDNVNTCAEYLECCKSYNRAIKQYIAIRLDDFVGIEAELKAEAERVEAIRQADLLASVAKDNEAKAQALKAKQDAELAEAKAMADKAQRETLEAEKLQADAIQATKDAELQSQIAKDGEAAMASFNTIANTATIVTNAPEARSGYEIEVTHISGYAQLIALWFELEAPKVALDKVPALKIDAIVKWAAKLAFTGGAKVTSQFVKYNEVFKAVNRK